jgi:imidazoleglycerol-phosphate dehydratase
MNRTAVVERKTKETQISAELNIDGNGKYEIETPIGFLTHMLEGFSKWGTLDLKMQAKGDVEVDQHHTVEDIGIVLGQAFDQALGDRKGINRAGFFAFPMDETLAIVAVDISGRPYLQFDCGFKRRMCGGLDTDLIEDLFQGFANNLKATLSIKVPDGRSDHHKVEAIFKAFGRAMRMACSKDPKMIEDIPSTKGVID